MNNNTFTASTTRRNAYHAPNASLLRRIYNEFHSLAQLVQRNNTAESIYYGSLHARHHHKGEHRSDE